MALEMEALNRVSSTTNTKQPEQPVDPQLKTWFEQATAYHQQGSYQQAETIYEKILTQYPSHADSLHLSGLIKGEKGQSLEAIKQITKAIQIHPNFFAYYFNRGLLYQKLNEHQQASDDFRRAILIEPSFLEAWLQLGFQLAQQHRYPEAIAAYQHARTIRAGDPRVLHQLGQLYLSTGQETLALACCEEVLATHPNQLETLINKGVALLGLKRAKEAISLYQQLLDTHPENRPVLNNLGLAYLQVQDYENARSIYETLTAQEPDNASFLAHLGLVHKEQGDLKKALTYFEQSLQIAPQEPKAAFNAAITYLAMGQWALGWRHYEARLRLHETQRVLTQLPPFTAPCWQGEPLSGKTILVMAEQGMGDTLQFLRYLFLLDQRGAAVIFECHSALTPFLTDQALPIQTLITPGEARPKYDFYIPLLSLPLRFQTYTEAAIPFAQQPYLKAPTKPSIELDQSNRLRVGLVWSGNPENPRDEQRSVPLEQLKSLLALKEIDFYSVQYAGKIIDGKIPEKSQAWVAAGFSASQDLSNAVGSFLGLAAVLSQLDLLITVDSAPAHLSGSLGQPTWVMLPHVSDFRWLTNRTDSPWYATLRLFRQPALGDWASVVKEIKTALKTVQVRSAITQSK